MSRATTRVLDLLDYVFRHERALLFGLLVIVLGGSWIWIIGMARDMYGAMDGWSAWMMSSRWDVPRLLLLWGMWAVMMAAMMLPAASPIMLLYLRSGRARESDARIFPRVMTLIAGYLAVWMAFSGGATALQRFLTEQMLLSPMMEPASDEMGAILLLVAGAYQLTPLKRVCLRACRSPMTFLMTHYRSGMQGAFHLGIRHGLYCLGCCWALMLLLFAGGVMNLLVIVALTAWVAIEKILAGGERYALASGILLLAMGIWMLIPNG